MSVDLQGLVLAGIISQLASPGAHAAFFGFVQLGALLQDQCAASTSDDGNDAEASQSALPARVSGVQEHQALWLHPMATGGTVAAAFRTCNH